MDAFLDTPWQIYAAALLMAFGVGITVRGLAMIGQCRHHRDPVRALWLARGIRAGIAGLCSIALGLGWMSGTDWMVFLALIILGQEMLEVSIMVAALRDEERRRRTVAGVEAGSLGHCAASPPSIC